MWIDVVSVLIDKKSEVMKDFVMYKLLKYTKVYDSLNDGTILSRDRKLQLYDIIRKLKGCLKCF